MEMPSSLLPCPGKDWADVSMLPETRAGSDDTASVPFSLRLFLHWAGFITRLSGSR